MRDTALVTLADASKHVGKPPGYFGIRRRRYRLHAELPFPQPVTMIAGRDVFHLQDLLVWDEARRSRDAQTRASWEEKRKARKDWHG